MHIVLRENKMHEGERKDTGVSRRHTRVHIVQARITREE